MQEALCQPTWIGASCGNFANLYWKTLDKHWEISLYSWQTVLQEVTCQPGLAPCGNSKRKLYFANLYFHGRTHWLVLGDSLAGSRLPTRLEASLARCGNFANLYWKTQDKHWKVWKISPEKMFMGENTGQSWRKQTANLAEFRKVTWAKVGSIFST